jgi:hypothetical protein
MFWKSKGYSEVRIENEAGFGLTLLILIVRPPKYYSWFAHPFSIRTGGAFVWSVSPIHGLYLVIFD